MLLQFKKFQAWIERKDECSVERVHSDHGGDFVALKDYVSEQGIEHTMSPPYSPNLNGIAERANRTIVECARTVLDNASLPKIFWAQAFVHAARIRNVFLCPRSDTSTSYDDGPETRSCLSPGIWVSRLVLCTKGTSKEIRRKVVNGNCHQLLREQSVQSLDSFAKRGCHITGCGYCRRNVSW